ncbi:hypothetical protein [Endozoicomonas arenosclerae]|uniref:hypothetical protein n=1 Tax=Endozoicomonas arenosclerae TaxID=1633495 RepID=UPI000784210B|nr:hypothetical protein [Endozoicomonas arenosclerae]
MKAHIFIILSFFLCSMEAQSKITKLDAKSFSHFDTSHETQRNIVIKGHTYIENLAIYLKDAAVEEMDSVAIDGEIVTELDKVQVVSVQKSNIALYSDAIAYIVSTKAGRHFFHFQAITRKTLYKDPQYYMLSAKIYEDQGTTTGEFHPIKEDKGIVDTTKSTEEVDKHVESLNPNIKVERDYLKTWATIELAPESAVWQEQDNKITIQGIRLEYKVLEEEDF